MRYCGPRGIPHDEFLSWPNHSQDAALWWLIHDAQTCPGCGTRPDEWDPARGGRPDAYEPVPVRCEGCARVEQRRDRITKDGAPQLRGTTVQLRRPAAGVRGG